MTRAWLLVVGALATLGFAVIVLVVIPQMLLVRVPHVPELAGYTDVEARGRQIYIREGCVYCHSQQVRDPTFTTDIDRGWGRRATVPSDYVYDRPHLLGTMRTGPDLINVGQRLPDPDWHLIHFYNPRAVNEWSIMPPFPYLFVEKDSSEVRPGDRVVPIRGPKAPAGKVVVATEDVLALTAYVISLKRQYPVPQQPATERHTVRGRGVHTMP